LRGEEGVLSVASVGVEIPFGELYDGIGSDES